MNFALRIFKSLTSKRTRTILFSASLIFGSASITFAQDATTTRIEHADKEPQNWLTFYGNYRGWSYSPLNQITRENVKNIVPVWAFPAGFPSGAAGLRPGLEAAPLVVDGVLYLEGMQNNVYAVDAATGRQIWTYEYTWPEVKTFSIRGARGLAYGDGRIYMGTQNNHVVALDAKTGAEVWNILVEENSECECRITAPPLYVKGKVLTGNAGSGYQALRGHINAYDAKTGTLVWHFEVIPAPGEPGAETWAGAENNYWKTGGGGAWFTGTYDPDTNSIFWGTGDPTPINGTLRPGPNLYTASLLALDADTGKLKWFFQETPHDLYDYDSASEPVLVDMDADGHKRQVIIHPTKNGFTYEYDRETGKFLRAFAYSAPNWNKGIDEQGRPIDPIVPKEQKDGLVCPSIHTGGRGIQHSAYSPHTGLWYTSDFELCTHFVDGGDKGDLVNPNVPPNISAFDPTNGKKSWTFSTKYYNMSSLLATAGDLIIGGDLEGNVFALDARTGKKLWSFNTGGRIASAAVSYSVNGRQFIAVGSGGGSETEGRLAKLYPESAAHIAQPASTLFVFALPEKEK
ncbi:MAG TPA: PQQ-binding-like beta-propeller repeat protein [Candidatus Saccharimonadales bacterium]|nr:PQQ-binding-like beta-propeller repeat protein [Candidatus Saccharimonadales bacterium]